MELTILLATLAAAVIPLLWKAPRSAGATTAGCVLLLAAAVWSARPEPDRTLRDALPGRIQGGEYVSSRAIELTRHARVKEGPSGRGRWCLVGREDPAPPQGQSRAGRVAYLGPIRLTRVRASVLPAVEAVAFLEVVAHVVGG